MIFDDLIAVQTIIGYGRIDAQRREDHDPEVERLYTSSPPIMEQIRQFEITRALGKKNKSDEVIILFIRYRA
jgi:hypothetical protein